MEAGKFKEVAAVEENKNWNRLIHRENVLYSRNNDIRSEFERDYTRVLHSLAYRRLKHKTQVFFNVDNDHICTRMEHVSHVESVSSTIGKFLGLNTELIRAIATAHDLGHAPFGHQGETVIKELTEKYLGTTFWHERNGLYFVDKVELLEDNNRFFQNLNLTYAVRDGIISHCGEVDENGIFPRDTLFDLKEFISPGQYQPATWEGCVVKIADKIAYLGRDIEDAYRLRFIDKEQLYKFKNLAQEYGATTINTTVIMHDLIIDICKNSSPEKGILLSKKAQVFLDELKKLNYDAIYHNDKLSPFKKYSNLVLTEIFNKYLEVYAGEETLHELRKQNKIYPQIMNGFSLWLVPYCDIDFNNISWASKTSRKSKNEKIYGKLETKEIYIRAIIDYLSGMTDRYAIELFNELISY